MFSFFRFWFFGKLVLLTPHGIDVNDYQLLTLNEPVYAISGGARVRIDVQSMLPKHINFSDGSTDKFFPAGCVTAKLSNSDNISVIFTSSNRLSPASDGSVTLVLNYNAQVPVDVKFNKIEIKTTCPLKGVNVYWDNRGSI